MAVLYSFRTHYCSICIHPDVTELVITGPLDLKIGQNNVHQLFVSVSQLIDSDALCKLLRSSISENLISFPLLPESNELHLLALL